MRRSPIIAAALTSVLSVLPLSELYAACTYTPVVGGEIRTCDNGRCRSTSRWSSDNRLIEVIEVECD
jgi:hypothetical protein